MKCDVCRTPLEVRTIGYIKSIGRGKRISECRRCHSAKRKEKERKICGSWMIVT